VLWDGATRTFKCPCHGAAFNDQGEPIAGPVNSPLRRVEFAVQDGVLKIT
jgi:Rieske Fe-S protein